MQECKKERKNAKKKERKIPNANRQSQGFQTGARGYYICENVFCTIQIKALFLVSNSSTVCTRVCVCVFVCVCVCVTVKHYSGYLRERERERERECGCVLADDVV